MMRATVSVESDTVTDPVRLRYHRGDVVAKLMQQQPELNDIGRVSKLAGVSRGTVSGLLYDEKDTEPEKAEAIVRVLGMTLAQVDEEVQRLNEGIPPVDHRPRTARTREEDHDIVLDESVRLGRKIATLPTAARSAIYALVLAFADAYHDKS